MLVKLLFWLTFKNPVLDSLASQENKNETEDIFLR